MGGVSRVQNASDAQNHEPSLILKLKLMSLIIFKTLFYRKLAF
jgi:hypothetical protein